MSTAVQHIAIQTLERLTTSAESFVNSLPQSKKANKKLSALLEAITQAQHVLSVEQTTEE